MPNPDPSHIEMKYTEHECGQKVLGKRDQSQMLGINNVEIRATKKRRVSPHFIFEITEIVQIMDHLKCRLSSLSVKYKPNLELNLRE